tara:strand:+ start:955 stop:1146 length:192 start_codon:yes stop_codon:yes gene_type:complete
MKTKLTSVKVLADLYCDFKVAVVNSKMSLQKLANRSMFLYLNDIEYRDRIDTENNLTVSGSNF